MPLTDKQQRFVEEYLVDLNATQAAIRAGYSEDTARSIGHENLTKPDIQEAVQAAMRARSERTQITADEVLRELAGIVRADTNELVEHRRGCCRFCWGKDHRYQRTPREHEAAERDHAQANENAVQSGRETTLFDEQGGLGFKATRAPNPDCPECFGEGESRAIFKDTREASAAARALYAGVKITRDGMEMKLHPKLDALEKVAKHIGFYAPQRHELTGKDGKDLPASGITFVAVYPDKAE